MNGPTDNCPPNGPGPTDGRPRLPRALTACCRVLVGAAFLMAAVSKISDLAGFLEQVQRVTSLPEPLALGVGHFLPWVELVCGFCLVTGFAAREAAVCTFGLLVLFLSHFLLGGGPANCGCLLSPLPEPGAGWWPPLRDAVLLLCSLRVAWCG